MYAMRFWGESGSRSGRAGPNASGPALTGSSAPGNEKCAGDVGSDLGRGAAAPPEGPDPESERERLPLLSFPCRWKRPMHAITERPLLLSRNEEEDELVAAFAFGIVAARVSAGTGGVTGVVGSSAADEAACMHL